jgi:peptidoglycan hydrolase-like protein with peptidoglycan-binding domain
MTSTHREATMGLWKFSVAGASWCLAAAVAVALTLAAPSPAAGTSARATQSVREAQQTLEALKLDPGPADGVMGPRTKAALKRFQEAEKLKATGTLDARRRRGSPSDGASTWCSSSRP